MSSQELVISMEKLKMVVGKDPDESHKTLSHASSSTEEPSKDYTNDDDDHGPNFIDDADKAYIILLNVFLYLSRKDLQSAAQVCKLWNLVGSDKIFWKRISLNNCIVHDRKMMVQILNKYQTEILDLRGMSFFQVERRSDVWSNFVTTLKSSLYLSDKWSGFYQALTEVTTLAEIIIDDCPPKSVTLIAKRAPYLKSLSAYRIRKTNVFSRAVPGYERQVNSLDLNPLRKMKDLLTLKLDNSGPTKLIFDKPSFGKTDNIELKLTTLSMNWVVNLSRIENVLPSTLVTLELGECRSLSFSFFEDVLLKLVNLKRLRLEMCHKGYLTNMIVEKVSKLPNLSELELINFVISYGFHEAIAKCTNLKSLLLIPLYKRIPQISHNLTNTYIFDGICMLKNLQVFCLVVTDQMTLVKNINSLNMEHDESIHCYLLNDDDEFGYNITFLANIPSLLYERLPDLELNIFKAHFSETWKLSLQNIENANFCEVIYGDNRMLNKSYL